jgi:hypothetical protein
MSISGISRSEVAEGSVTRLEGAVFFVCLALRAGCAARADDTDRLVMKLLRVDDKQSAVAGGAAENVEAMGVTRIRGDQRVRVREHRRRFRERDAVLLLVRRGFRTIPFELHA